MRFTGLPFTPLLVVILILSTQPLGTLAVKYILRTQHLGMLAVKLILGTQPLGKYPLP